MNFGYIEELVTNYKNFNISKKTFIDRYETADVQKESCFEENF